MLPSSHPNRNALVSLETIASCAVVPMLIMSAVTTPRVHAKEPAIDWHSQDFQEFVPQSFEGQQMVRGAFVTLGSSSS